MASAAPPSDWHVRTVAELQAARILLVEDGNHGEYRPLREEFTSNGVPFIRAADMDEGRILFETASRINAVARARIRKGVGAGGDVLLSHKGTVGKVAFAPLDTEPFVCSPQTTFWRVLDDGKLDRRYLYAFMRSPAFHEQLRSRKVETDMADYVSLTVQRTLKVTLPPIALQRDIGAFLGALDDKIELNRRVSETLEGIAATLFAQRFASTDKAEVEHRPLTNYVEVNPRRILKAGEPAPYLDMGNMPTRSARALGWAVREAGSGARFINGDTLVARITPCLENGKTAFVDFLEDGQVAWGSTEYIVLRSRDPLPPEWAYLLARTNGFRSFAISHMNGSSGRQRVPADCFSRFMVPVPDPKVASEFGSLVRPLFDRMRIVDEECRALAGLRDTLLPRLLSGELRLHDAEREVALAT